MLRFNKRREDFPDLRSYNDYLEWVENMSPFRSIACKWNLFTDIIRSL